MNILRKLFKLPSPVELGRSEHNALPDRRWTPDIEDDVYDWNDYDAEVKRLYPVKFFFAKTLHDFLRYHIWLPLTRPIKDAIYWLKCHLLPSRRYHMLDLRQPCQEGDLKNLDCYRYGWVDVDGRMLYALFNLLGEYFQEQPYDLTTHYTLEQINADPGYKRQHDTLLEARAIYHWWRVERKQALRDNQEMLTRWHDLHQKKETRQNGEARKVFEEMKLADQILECKTDEMIARLMKIRRSLWT